MDELGEARLKVSRTGDATAKKSVRADRAIAICCGSNNATQLRELSSKVPLPSTFSSKKLWPTPNRTRGRESRVNTRQKMDS